MFRRLDFETKTVIAVQIVETVRESSIDAILDKFHYINGDDVIDPNGERIEWLEGTIAEPYLVTKFHSDGRERLKNAFQSGQLEFKTTMCEYENIVELDEMLEAEDDDDEIISAYVTSAQKNDPLHS